MLERRSNVQRAAFAAFALAVGVAACSDGDSTTEPSAPVATSGDTALDDPFVEVTSDISESGPSPTGGESAPTQTTNPPVEGTPDEPPIDDGAPRTTAAPVAAPDPSDIERVVSLSPSHTETLFELGAGDLVVAVDHGSDFPAEAVALSDSQLDVRAADLDVVLSYEPDLVVIGDDPTGMAGRLSEAGIATYVGPQPDSLGEVYDQIDDIGALLGRDERADELVGGMQDAIEQIQASLPAGVAEAGLTVFHEIDPSLFTPSGQSFYSDLYVTVGLTNIAGPGDSGRVTQLTAEEVIAADPDVIVLADVDCCAVTPERVASRPGWSDVSAVSSGAVVGVPDALVMRWGPRIVDFLRLVADGVESAAG